ncbi:hypothetical protein CEXT_104821 [Caerostris extrusa]|uniref:Uncharacterized protein n=1 Tax=Caerostris extrusa TaxID=172846 RepID=A0AAV4XSU5_CAEEX|nr:hypothetical protein CEXT_104821 [Caerostris extrusa]
MARKYWIRNITIRNFKSILYTLRIPFHGNPKSYLQTTSLENEITAFRAKIPSGGGGTRTLSAPLAAIVVVVWGSIVRRGFPEIDNHCDVLLQYRMLVVMQRGTAWVARNYASLFGNGIE